MAAVTQVKIWVPALLQGFKGGSSAVVTDVQAVIGLWFKEVLSECVSCSVGSNCRQQNLFSLVIAGSDDATWWRICCQFWLFVYYTAVEVSLCVGTLLVTVRRQWEFLFSFIQMLKMQNMMKRGSMLWKTFTLSFCKSTTFFKFYFTIQILMVWFPVSVSVADGAKFSQTFRQQFGWCPVLNLHSKDTRFTCENNLTALCKHRSVSSSAFNLFR